MAYNVRAGCEHAAGRFPSEAEWPEPQPDFEQQTKAKEAEVKVMESKRRDREDQAAAAEGQLKLSIAAATQNDLQNYRMRDMALKKEIAMEKLRSEERIASMKIQQESADRLRAMPVGGTA